MSTWVQRLFTSAAITVAMTGLGVESSPIAPAQANAARPAGTDNSPADVGVEFSNGKMVFPEEVTAIKFSRNTKQVIIEFTKNDNPKVFRASFPKNEEVSSISAKENGKLAMIIGANNLTTPKDGIEIGENVAVQLTREGLKAQLTLPSMVAITFKNDDRRLNKLETKLELERSARYFQDLEIKPKGGQIILYEKKSETEVVLPEGSIINFGAAGSFTVPPKEKLAREEKDFYKMTHKAAELSAKYAAQQMSGQLRRR